MSPSTHNMLAVIVKKEKYEVLSIDDDLLKLIDEKDNLGPEIEYQDISSTILKEIQEAWIREPQSLFVTVLSAMGKWTIQECKVVQ